MTKRLQVLLEDEEFGEIRRAARKRRQSVAEWVRAALRQARDADAGRPVSEKLQILHSSGAHEFPTGSIEEMLDEIGRGYSGPPVIFIDSNIPMYLVGAAHPNKEGARRIVERAIIDGERLVTDAEVFQEILHRYVAIDRREAISPAFETLLGIVDAVLPIDLADVQRARTLLTAPALQARDAIHVAVMQRHDISRVMSFDRAFDLVPGIDRLA